MRYDAEHKQKTRDRVLTEAGKAIRAEGPHRMGVAGVMARAGLTHGGFYAHFASKDDLVAATIDRMFAEMRDRLHGGAEVGPREALQGYVGYYLSRTHRDSRTAGCPLPFLMADAPRLERAARERFAQGVVSLTSTLSGHLSALGWADADCAASSMLAEMVGALSMARAEPDPERSDRILEHSRQALRRRYDLETDA